ncbi:MAG: hypothetical protein HY927_13875 [Elusimicrobia bacterium]|nr:hypothetical protein [Elusimicrobiota bacterium]
MRPLPRGGALLAGAALLAPLLLGACATQKVVTPPVVISPKSVPEANFELATFEVVENPEEDTVSFVKVFVDGEAAGQTQAGPKSSEKRWQSRLTAGNRLVRLEAWAVSPSGEAQLAAGDIQPRERFVRVEEGQRTKVSLKFYDKGRKNSLQVAREPMP